MAKVGESSCDVIAMEDEPDDGMERVEIDERPAAIRDDVCRQNR
jgi:hypothetical protein